MHTYASGPSPAHVRLQVKSSAGTPGDTGGAVHTSPSGQSRLSVHVIVPVSPVDSVAAVLLSSVAPELLSEELPSALAFVDGPLSLSVSTSHTLSTHTRPGWQLPLSQVQPSVSGVQASSLAPDIVEDAVDPLSPCESLVVVSSAGQAARSSVESR